MADEMHKVEGYNMGMHQSLKEIHDFLEKGSSSPLEVEQRMVQLQNKLVNNASTNPHTVKKPTTTPLPTEPITEFSLLKKLQPLEPPPGDHGMVPDYISSVGQSSSSSGHCQQPQWCVTQQPQWPQQVPVHPNWALFLQQQHMQLQVQQKQNQQVQPQHSARQNMQPAEMPQQVQPQAQQVPNQQVQPQHSARQNMQPAEMPQQVQPQAQQVPPPATVADPAVACGKHKTKGPPPATVAPPAVPPPAPPALPPPATVAPLPAEVGQRTAPKKQPRPPTGPPPATVAPLPAEVGQHTAIKKHRVVNQKIQRVEAQVGKKDNKEVDDKEVDDNEDKRSDRAKHKAGESREKKKRRKKHKTHSEGDRHEKQPDIIMHYRPASWMPDDSDDYSNSDDSNDDDARKKADKKKPRSLKLQDVKSVDFLERESNTEDRDASSRRQSPRDRSNKLSKMQSKHCSDDVQQRIIAAADDGRRHSFTICFNVISLNY